MKYFNSVSFLAAHCMRNKNAPRQLQVDEFVVLLGRFNLDRRFEPYSHQRDVSEIHMSPFWRYLSEKWDADLAVLVMKEAVMFSPYIQPVCIPTSIDTERFMKGVVVS